MRIEWIAVTLCALGVADSSCQGCNVSCIQPDIFIAVPPHADTEVLGVQGSGACNAAGTCLESRGSGCDEWTVALTSPGACMARAYLADGTATLFTTNVSRIEGGCCPGLSASIPYFNVALPAGADAGTGDAADASSP